MSRTLTVLVRRDPSRDRQDDQIAYAGFRFHWPDGRAIGIGLDAFCKYGQRWLGLGKHPDGLLEMICFPLRDLEDALTKLPGARVRRLFLERQGRQGRLHFLDGTPTAIVFDLDADEMPVLHWIGLSRLRDGERQWLDLAARPINSSNPQPRKVKSYEVSG